ERLLEQFATAQLYPTVCNDWAECTTSPEPLRIAIAKLRTGCDLDSLLIISEAQITGQAPEAQKRQNATTQDVNNIIRNLTELRIGEPVVHIDHGLGRYLGLQTLTVNNQTNEFVTLEYADQTKLYVPVTNLHLISRYGSMEADKIALNKLGTEQWQKAREKAAKRAHDVAAELLAIHAERANKPGFQFNTPDEQYQQFAAHFPFELTADQVTAISQIITDMSSERAMDRLVCGDVGFGKTEVAMRAAFLAVQSGKQVAVLVPTTLLAQQHYETFKERFAETAAQIAVLSRFNSGKQQEKALADLAAGKVDIIIGTHKLIQSDVKFHNLGLLIIDEEHRFGVRQKERLKALRAEVDILTLTATPIPRTLNMALSDVRDLSIIGTPPAKRLAVKTFVHEYASSVVREALLREIMRGGQAFYLHNSIDTIEQRCRELQELMPEAKVQAAHGQMPEAQLEKIMADFYHQRFNVLVCTTIIENGIDIPTANTIVIERADKLGLAQLHQLRGRVGRSHHQAYAYLLTPHANLLTRDAEKRLEAISQLEDLGIGFALATHDLEIRGAGEFLGDEQSGHIQTVGFSLYMEFLERAVESLKAGIIFDFSQPLPHSTEVDLQIPALIPESYLHDVHMRLILYKRIASAKTSDELRALETEMIDRFGLLPEPTKHLFAVTQLKLQAAPLGIRKISANRETVYLDFLAQPNIDPLQIIQLIQKQPKQYKMEGSSRLRVILPDKTKTAERLTALLSSLAIRQK
ncbi:MAG: transcription-repair coupling factor, partial [Gammaproteobacteria bacterium]|nr:transcription-repair coupling factor [Gammaproteobacteria bacterium]